MKPFKDLVYITGLYINSFSKFINDYRKYVQLLISKNHSDSINSFDNLNKLEDYFKSLLISHYKNRHYENIDNNKSKSKKELSIKLDYDKFEKNVSSMFDMLAEIKEFVSEFKIQKIGNNDIKLSTSQFKYSTNKLLNKENNYIDKIRESSNPLLYDIKKGGWNVESDQVILIGGVEFVIGELVRFYMRDKIIKYEIFKKSQMINDFRIMKFSWSLFYINPAPYKEGDLREEMLRLYQRTRAHMEFYLNILMKEHKLWYLIERKLNEINYEWKRKKRKDKNGKQLEIPLIIEYLIDLEYVKYFIKENKIKMFKKFPSNNKLKPEVREFLEYDLDKLRDFYYDKTQYLPKFEADEFINDPNEEETFELAFDLIERVLEVEKKLCEYLYRFEDYMAMILGDEYVNWTG